MKIEKCYEKSINMTLNLKQNTQKTQKEKSSFSKDWEENVG